MTAAVRIAVAQAIAKERITDEELIERLQGLAAVRRDEPLARHTTFGIGGPADVFVTVRSADELAAVTKAIRAAGAPLFVLGAGSNILVGDSGIRGVTIDNQAKAVRIEPLRVDAASGLTVPDAVAGAAPDEAVVVWAESGTSFAALARQLARAGYEGIEWAAGIPGTLGGAAVYNAGAYGGCLADVLLAATLIDDAGDVRYMRAPDLKLAYRSSAILRGEFGACVVLSVELAVRRGDAAASLAKIAEFDLQRLAAQPRGRNSGSTFKNPPDHHAWELIDAVGLRGHRIGNARISEKHSNFFENLGGASAADVHALMGEAQRRVKERFGIDLENEVELVGEGF
ncbi:MAG TPA: UDP-N-acetylmuramate dehydrogenase [Dehalococcoidia bacterium]